MSRDQLQAAYQLIKDGQKVRAEAILQPIVEAEPDNADAWWLLANSQRDSDAKLEAVNQVLRLRPDHSKAQLMRERLGQIDDPGDSLDALLETDYLETSSDSGNPRIVVTKPKGQNNRLIILVVIGLVALVGCGVCFTLASGVGVVFNEIISDPDIATVFMELGDMLEFAAMPETLNDQGVIEPGQNLTGTTGNPAIAWTFSGSAGESFVIDAVAQDNDVDPTLSIYGPDNMLVDLDDDSGGGRDAQLRITLRDDGIYTIVVSAFGNDNGSVELSLTRE